MEPSAAYKSIWKHWKQIYLLYIRLAIIIRNTLSFKMNFYFRFVVIGIVLFALNCAGMKNHNSIKAFESWKFKCDLKQLLKFGVGKIWFILFQHNSHGRRKLLDHYSRLSKPIKTPTLSGLWGTTSVRNINEDRSSVSFERCFNINLLSLRVSEYTIDWHRFVV